MKYKIKNVGYKYNRYTEIIKTINSIFIVVMWALTILLAYQLGIIIEMLK